MSIREDAIAAYHRKQEDDFLRNALAMVRRDDERRNRMCQVVVDVLGSVGIERISVVDATCYVDYLQFYVRFGSKDPDDPDGLELILPCPECGAEKRSLLISDLADLGWALSFGPNAWQAHSHQRAGSLAIRNGG